MDLGAILRNKLLPFRESFPFEPLNSTRLGVIKLNLYDQVLRK